mmetsp:Transcript_5914/g.14223  ORF Transcript_5914/g.14223 Transcript_5914/m.14223 type:complete len:104 (+) Transcript_5914:3051-3362(+)
MRPLSPAMFVSFQPFQLSPFLSTLMAVQKREGSGKRLTAKFDLLSSMRSSTLPSQTFLLFSAECARGVQQQYGYSGCLSPPHTSHLSLSLSLTWQPASQLMPR